MAKRRTLWDYNEMGLYFYGREAYELAIGEFERALKAASYPNPALHVNLAAAYLREEDVRGGAGAPLEGLGARSP